MIDTTSTSLTSTAKELAALFRTEAPGPEPGAHVHTSRRRVMLTVSGDQLDGYRKE